MEVRAAGEQLTTTQVAAALGVSPSFVCVLVARGEIKSYRLGRKTIRISPEDLATYLAARRTVCGRCEGVPA